MAIISSFGVIIGFSIVAIAAYQIARYFQYLRLPIITGFLVTGVLSGPFVLGLIPSDSIVQLKFINEIALSFIAFAAASELYIKNLRSRLNNIKWLTIGQLGITFTLLVISIFFIEQLVPFSANQPWPNRLVIAMLISAIFCARSPSSVIPVINEMRAKGSYTSSVMGTTVLLDFLVIILFAMVLSFGIALYEGADVNFISLLKIILEIASSIALGMGFAFILNLLLGAKIKLPIKGILLLVLGFIIFSVSDFISYLPQNLWSISFHLEPLLICIVAGYRITNFTRHRQEFIKIIHDIGPFIYCAFFTAVGAMLNIQLIYDVLPSALLLMGLNAILLFVGTSIGARISKEPAKRASVYWMAFLTQAGVGLGLVTTVIDTFPSWGQEFSTLVISVIIMNQLIGPPFFKWAIGMVGESHERASVPEFDGIRDAIVIGFESQSVALARQLKKHGWEVKLVTRKQDLNGDEFPDVDIRIVENLNLEALEKIEAEKSEAIVLMLTDAENLKLCELIYEKIGTKDVVVRLNHRYNFDKFHKLGALIVDPSTAMVSLMDHFVRSPQATSLLLGMQEGQDTIDIQVLNANLFGLPLRDLRLPSDIIVLSIRRKGQMIISHGYTRLRKGDWVTMVGSTNSLNKMTLLFDSSNGS